MRSDDFDFLSNLGTMWQVVFGAVLATIGGFVATQIEWYVESRRRERNAAIFLGEVLSTLKSVLVFAHDTKKIGEPFGSVTLRLLRAARREIDIYDRNRENLVDLGDSKLRARIHAVMLRITAPLDGIFDTTQEIQTLEMQLKSTGIPEEFRSEAETRIARTRDIRESGFEYLMETAEHLTSLVAALEPLAGNSFETHGEIVRNPRPNAAQPSPPPGQ